MAENSPAAIALLAARRRVARATSLEGYMFGEDAGKAVEVVVVERKGASGASNMTTTRSALNATLRDLDAAGILDGDQVSNIALGHALSVSGQAHLSKYSSSCTSTTTYSEVDYDSPAPFRALADGCSSFRRTTHRLIQLFVRQKARW